MGANCPCPVPPDSAFSEECAGQKKGCTCMVGSTEFFISASEPKQDSDLCTPSGSWLHRSQSSTGGKATSEELQTFKHAPENLVQASASACAADLAARHEAYQERRKRKKGSKGATERDNFLSNLPEVEADIAYRFSFSVVGDKSEEVVTGVCNSPAAQRLPGGQAVCTSPALSMSRSTSSKESGADDAAKVHRCLCSVSSTAPVTTPGQTDVRLAKLAFHVVGPGEDVPPCRNRKEACSTMVVFVVILDTRGDLDYLELQLLDCAQQASRCHAESFFPPRRAAIFCYDEGAELVWRNSQWESFVADFEQEHGCLWKLGPFNLADVNAMHAAFAEMASDRILREEKDDSDAAYELDGACPEGFVAERPPVFEAESSSDSDSADSDRRGSAAAKGKKR